MAMSYNPQGYVPGGANTKVAKAIVKAATPKPPGGVKVGAGAGAGASASGGFAYDPSAPWTWLSNQMAGVPAAGTTGSYLPKGFTLNPSVPDTGTGYLKGLIQTPSQMSAAARQQASVDEQGILAGIQAIYDRQASSLNQQAGRAQGFAQALEKLYAGEDSTAEESYNRAASTIGGLGTGLSGAVGRNYDEATAKTKADLDRIVGGGAVPGMPTGSQIATASQYAGSTVPATTLAEDALNARRLAAADATSRSYGIDIIGQNYRSQANQVMAEEAAQEAAQIAKRPATIQALLTQMQQSNNQNVGNLVSALGSRASLGASLKSNAMQTFQNAQTLAQGSARERREQINSLAQIAQAMSTNQLGYAALRDKAMAGDTKAANDLGKQGRAEALERTKTFHFQWEYDPATGQVKPVTQDNHVVPVGAWKVDPTNPYAVIPRLKPGTTKSGAISKTKWAGMLGDLGENVATWATGTKPTVVQNPAFDKDNPDDSPAFVMTPGTGSDPITYDEALSRAINAGDGSQRWSVAAKRIVDREYDEGENGRPFSKVGAAQIAMQAVKIAKKAGQSRATVLKFLEKAPPQGWKLDPKTGGLQYYNQSALPQDAVLAAVNKIYGKAPSLGGLAGNTGWPPAGGYPPGFGDIGGGGSASPPVTKPGAAWNKSADPPSGPPIYGQLPGTAIQYTQSGHYVNLKTGKYVAR